MYRDDQGRTITLTNELARGGEGRICATREHPHLVAKLLDNPSREAGAKLQAMLANPCREGTAWPERAIHDLHGQHCGHLMPRVTNARQLSQLYNPKQRLTIAPGFHYLYLVTTAANIVATIRGIHEHQYVIGDVADANILVQPTATVTFIDNDSYQVRRPYQGGYYRCRVGTDEYTPPELIGVEFASVDRTTHHDNWSATSLIFRLVMEGVHPFAARYHATGDPPKLIEKIQNGQWPYQHNNYFTPPATAPSINILPPRLQALFRRCFVDGHRQPQLRPTPAEWHSALLEFKHNLRTCTNNQQHYYGNHLNTCPWCERTRQYGIDPFPQRQVPRTPSPSSWQRKRDIIVKQVNETNDKLAPTLWAIQQRGIRDAQTLLHHPSATPSTKKLILAHITELQRPPSGLRIASDIIIDPTITEQQLLAHKPSYTELDRLLEQAERDLYR